MKNFSNNMQKLKTRTSFKTLVLLIFLVTSISVSAQVQKDTILNPIHDAYLEGGSRFNNETLRLQSNSPTREAYLMFDLSGIPANDITALELELTVYTDDGSGTINVYKGDSNNWTENNLSNSNKPNSSGSPLGSFFGTHALGDVKTLVLSESILNGDLISFVIKHTTTADVAFGSTGPETSSTFDRAPSSKWPKLKVTYTVASAADTQAPNVPTGLIVNGFDYESAAISWNASSDNGGGNIAGYYVYNNGSQIGTSSDTTENLTGLTAETLYQISVAAYDDASPPNLSSPSSPTANFTTSSAPGGGGPGNINEVDGAGITNIFYDGQHVGIGVNPRSDYTLSVAGDVISEKVRVELQGTWPDYVFKDDYMLPTLEEVQKQIQEKGHLLNMPSAVQVEEEGIDLGQMNKLLLEKVEELTLYIIQQDQQQKLLESRIKSLEGIK